MNRSQLALIIILIAITASLEALPKYVVLNGLSLPTSSSPLSKGPYGTQTFFDLLRAHGYNVKIIGSPEDLNYINAQKVLLIVISPTYISDQDISTLLDVIGRFKEFKVIVADEASGASNSYKFSYLLSEELCPGYIIYPKPLTRPFYSEALAVFSLPGQSRMYSLMTAYVTSIEVYDAISNKMLTNSYNTLVSLPLSLKNNGIYKIELLGLVSGMSSSGGAIRWLPFIVVCVDKERRTGMMVIGDGSIFINEALNKSKIYAMATESLVRYFLNGEKDYVIISIEDFYASPKLKLRYRFLPSLFLTWVVRAYKNIEDSLYSLIRNRAPIFLLLLSLGFMLVPLSFMPQEIRSLAKGSKTGKIKGTGLSDLCKKIFIWINMNEDVIEEKGVLPEVNKVKLICKLTNRKLLRILIKSLALEGLFKRWIIEKLRRAGIYIDEEV
jgi:hypothetical protein